MTILPPQTQQRCSLRRRRRRRTQSLPGSATAAATAYACAVLALVSTSCFCPLNLPTASAQQQSQPRQVSQPNHRRVATKTRHGSITYDEYDEILDQTNQNIHFPNSPLDDYSGCDADYPAGFVEYIYLTFYNVDEPLIERTSPEDYDRFLSIVKRVMNECTGDDGECINVERVEIVEDTVDTFDYDATFVDGVGHRQLQNRKKRRGKRNVKKLRVEGRNYSRRKGRLLLREKSKDQRERRQLLSLYAQQQQQQEQLVDDQHNERALQEGTGTCGEMLLNRLRRADLTSFDCLASIEVTSYDLRCLDEQLLEANRGPNGRNGINGLNGPMMVSAQVENDDEEVEGPPRNRARGRENEGPSLIAGGQQPKHTALPYNTSDRTDPGIQYHSNQDRPEQMAGSPADTASSAGTDWTSGAKYSPNHD